MVLGVHAAGKERFRYTSTCWLCSGKSAAGHVVGAPAARVMRGMCSLFCMVLSLQPATIFNPAPCSRWAVVGVDKVASLATEPAVIASGFSFDGQTMGLVPPA